MFDLSYRHWGYHLIIDMAGCNDKINNVKDVSSFMGVLVKRLDMKPIGDLIIHYIDDETGKGVSAVQIITTSTITFHGDDDGRCVYLDVFSCKPYEPQVVFELVNEYFTPTITKHKLINRDAEHAG